MIYLNERQHKLKKVSSFIGAKTVGKGHSFLFSPTHTFIKVCSNLPNTFSPINYLLFWRYYNATNQFVIFNR